VRELEAFWLFRGEAFFVSVNSMPMLFEDALDGGASYSYLRPLMT